MLICIDVNEKNMRVTSEVLAGSTGENPVIVRNVLSQLKTAGIITAKQGCSGANLVKPLSEVTLYDVYKAVDCTDEDGLFRFHSNPDPECPIGRNIHKVSITQTLCVNFAAKKKKPSETLSECFRELAVRY